MVAFDAFIGAPDRPCHELGCISSAQVRSRTSALCAHIRHSSWSVSASARMVIYWIKNETKGEINFLRGMLNVPDPYLVQGDGQSENHFSLVNWISANCKPEDRDTMCTLFDSVDIPAIETMLQRKFRRIITQIRIGFIRDLLYLRIRSSTEGDSQMKRQFVELLNHVKTWGMNSVRAPSERSKETTLEIYRQSTDESSLVGRLWCEDGEFVFRYDSDYRGRTNFSVP